MDGNLRARIINELRKPGVGIVEISERSGVHKSQVSRFKNGKFLRLSKNLARVCSVLQIALKSATCDNDLTLAVHEAWDGSSKGKERLLAILKTLKEWG